MKDLNVNVAQGVAELIVRTGDAPKIYDPITITVIGTIAAPAAYYLGRKQYLNFDLAKALVTVNRQHGKIVFEPDPTNKFAEKIEGKLVENAELDGFKIGSGDAWAPKDLGKFLRRKRMFFKDPIEGAALIHELQSVKVSVKGEIEQVDDGRGNTKKSVAHAIKTNIPLSFWLEMPVYKGGPKVGFQVEIYLELSGSSIYCYLESVEMDEAIKKQVDQLIDEELKTFKADQVTVVEV